MDWNQVIVIVGSNIGIMFSTLGFTAAFIIYTNKRIDSFQKEMKEDIRDIYTHIFKLEKKEATKDKK